MTEAEKLNPGQIVELIGYAKGVRDALGLIGINRVETNVLARVDVTRAIDALPEKGDFYTIAESAIFRELKEQAAREAGQDTRRRREDDEGLGRAERVVAL